MVDMPVAKVMHLALAFAIELAAIAAFGLWGYAGTTGISKWIIGIGAPVFLVVLWSIYAAPASNSRLDLLPLLIFKIAVYTMATLAFFKTGHPIGGAGFGIVSIISLALSAILRY
jgi:hypothetical protein